MSTTNDLKTTLLLGAMTGLIVVCGGMRDGTTGEYAADATGARIAGSPHGLTRALEKLGQLNRRVPMDASPASSHRFIVMPLGGDGVARWFSTHPPIEERVRRLLGR